MGPTLLLQKNVLLLDPLAKRLPGNGSRGISGCELTGGSQSKPTYFPLASWPAPARLILVEFQENLPRFEGTNHHCPNEFDEKKGVLEKR